MKTRAIYLTSFLSAALLLAGRADATYIMTLEQVGSNVVGSGSGTIDTTDLVEGSIIVNEPPRVLGKSGLLLVGSQNNDYEYYYVNGPREFGSGGNVLANTGSGDSSGISQTGVVVPQNYVSGSFLTGNATWDNTTLAGLGVTPGTYTWTWGSGADADSLTLYAGVPVPSAVPEPAPMLLLGGGLAALGVVRLRKVRNRQGCSIEDAKDITIYGE